MPRTTRARIRSLTLLVCVTGAVAAHLTLGAGISESGTAFAFLPAIVIACWFAILARTRVLVWVALAGAVAAVYVLERWGGVGFALAYGLPHAAAYVFLLCYFGRSLRPGREPLVTRVARQIRGTLPPELERYTRRLTIAWCVFFAGQVAVSVTLLAFGSLQVWSLFVNVLNVPLVTAMFLGDYAYRFARFRDHRAASIPRVWRAFVEDASGSFSARSR